MRSHGPRAMRRLDMAVVELEPFKEIVRIAPGSGRTTVGRCRKHKDGCNLTSVGEPKVA